MGVGGASGWIQEDQTLEIGLKLRRRLEASFSSRNLYVKKLKDRTCRDTGFVSYEQNEDDKYWDQ